MSIMLSVKNLGYEVESHRVFSDVSFTISPGEKVGLIGPNGAGKSTLLGVLAGTHMPTSGELVKNNIEIGILPQDLKDWLDASVQEFIETVTGVKGVRDEYAQAEVKYTEEPNEKTLILFCDAAEKLGHFGVDEFDKILAKSLKQAGLSDQDASKEIGQLSGGQKTRVALAAVMASRYDLILLDEPTNNLDIEGVVLLEKFIQGSKAAFLMVSHDRRFLRNATTRIIELLGGDQGVNQYGLGYDEYVEARAHAYTVDMKRYEEHKMAIRSLEVSARERRVRAGSAETANRRSSDGDKLGANYRSGRAANHMAGQAKAIEARLERLKREAPHKPQEPISLDFLFQESDKIHKRLLTISDVTINYTTENGLLSLGPYNLTIDGGERVVVTGANGTGKSSLIESINNSKNVASGNIQLGSGVRLAYIDQAQTVPMPLGSPLENIKKLAPGISDEDAIHLLVKFNLSRDTARHVAAEKLSGGERAKILLAAIAATKANLLLLDEPTNNLDIPTIEGLQDALKSYGGALLLVSHDRDFIEGIGYDRIIKLDS